MKRNQGYNDLERAAVLVREGQQRIARQKALIAALKDKGQPTHQAEAMLKTFERSLLEIQNHRVILSDLLSPSVD